MSDESVKVAVRVRPFNQRERDRRAKLTIEMLDNKTIITNPEYPNEKKMFTFDYSYWSHDGFKENENGVLIPDGPNSKYASQASVFADLGQDVLENAFKGYNCSLFAYGQTGSGKSYSMVGYGANKGMVPVICEELFKKMKVNSTESMRYEVSFSMLEIYNENVRDLLSKEDIPKGGLPVRQTPLHGFYVQGLKKVPVGSYKEIESRMDQGTSNRTVAMTNMNATSSRAHTVVIITFDQVKQSNGSDIRKSSIMNLVDLAGSERADSTGATGDRLKEGANINKSLSVLGNVISALADLSNGKRKVVVPYRDSVLTKLLQNALGGNSKTVMIAALSPADINYEETLGTLRYADRAKQIKNKAVINENPIDKLLRELKEENEKLKQSLNSGNIPQLVNTQGLSSEEINNMRQEIIEALKAQMVVNSESIAAEDPKNWSAKLEEARKEVAHISKEEKNEVIKRSKIPHLLNLNEDPQLSGVLVHYVMDKKTLITRIDDKVENNSEDEDDESIIETKSRKKMTKQTRISNENEISTIVLKGLSISNKHAILERQSDNCFTIRPALFGAKTKVNGFMLTNEIPLNHKDRILFGSNHMYIFINPFNTKEDKNLPKVIDWEYAQSEIAHAEGFETKNFQGLTKDQQVVQQQILEILPMISEVNAIAEELQKYKCFSVILVPPNTQGLIFGASKRTAIMIKVIDTKNGNFWLWERGKFMNRRFLMQELYQQYLEDYSLKKTGHAADPFWEPVDEVLLGTANVFLQSLAFNLDFDDKIAILNFDGNEEGVIFVSITPSTSNGRAINENYFVDDPKSLLTRTYHFVIKILKVELHNSKYTHGIKVKYRVFKEEKSFETSMIKDTVCPVFNYHKVISFARMTQDHLDYFEHGYITFQIYIDQEDRICPVIQQPSINNAAGIKTDKRRLSVIPVKEPSEEMTRFKTDLIITNKKLTRLERKDKLLKTLCKDFKASKSNDFESFYKNVTALLFCCENLNFRSTESSLENIMSQCEIDELRTPESTSPESRSPESRSPDSRSPEPKTTTFNRKPNSFRPNNNSSPREPMIEEEDNDHGKSREASLMSGEAPSSKACVVM